MAAALSDLSSMVNQFLNQVPIHDASRNCRYGAPLSSSSKLVHGLMARAGKREPGDFLWMAFAVIGSLEATVRQFWNVFRYVHVGTSCSL